MGELDFNTRILVKDNGIEIQPNSETSPQKTELVEQNLGCREHCKVKQYNNVSWNRLGVEVLALGR